MAIVRRWQRQAETAPLAPPRPVERETSGYRALAQGLGQVADAKAAIDAKELADARRTRETAAANQLRAARVTLEDAANQAKGRVALEVDLLGGATKELQAQADKLAEEAGDPVLAEQIRLHHKDQEFQLTHSIRTHIGAQADAFALQTHKDALEGADLDAQRAAEKGDDEGVLAAVERKAGAIRREAARLGRDGASDDYLRTELPAQLGLLHAGVISTLNSGEHPQPKKAARYLDLHRSEMSPALANKIEKELLGDVQEDEGATRAREIVSFSVFADSGRFDYTTAKKGLDDYLASDASPKAKAAATQEFTAAAARADRAFGAKISDTVEQAQTLIEKNGWSVRAAAAQLKWLRRDDVGQGKLAADLEKWAAAGLEEKTAGRAPTREQQSAMVDFLLSLPTSSGNYAAKPESFKQAWTGRLAPRDLKQAAMMVAQFGVAARKPDESLPVAVISALTTLGRDAGKWGPKGPINEEQKMLFYGLTQALLAKQAELRAAGTDATKVPDLLLGHAREQLRSGTAFTASGDEVSGVTTTEATNPAVAPGLAGSVFIPDDARKRYEDKLRTAGLPPDSRDWLLYLYQVEQGVDPKTLPLTPRMKADQDAVNKLQESGKRLFDPKTGEYIGRTR